VSLRSKSLEAQRLHSEYGSLWSVAIAAVDIAMFIVAAFLAAAIYFHETNLRVLVEFFFYSSIVFVVFWIGLFYWLGLYRQSFAMSVRDEFYYIVAALLVGIFPQFALFTLVPSLSSSRLILVLAAAFAIVLVGGCRAVSHAVVAAVRERTPQRVAVLSNDTSVESYAATLGLREGATVLRVGSLPELENEQETLKLLRGAIAAARSYACTMLVLPEMLPASIMPYVAETAEQLHIRVVFALPGLRYQSCAFRMTRSGEQALIEPIRLRACTPRGRLLKRIFDLALAVPILTLAAPVMLLAALAIWLESGGPVFYRQERVGRDNVPFSVLKFRTMRKDHGSGAWATRNDPRITRVGAFLRRTSIDELPQLLNVLRGEMSIVGPRPEMVAWANEFAQKYPRYNERHLVRPGITGWSQIYMKRLLEPSDAPDVLQHDLFYIEHWGLLMDLSIICKTAVEFLFHRPA